MPDVPILLRERRWACPNCTTTAVTWRSEPHTEFHICRRSGLNAPMVLDGVKAKIEAIERGDYVGDDNPQVDHEGRPIMAILTTRDDGQDCSVLAPNIGAVTL